MLKIFNMKPRTYNQSDIRELARISMINYTTNKAWAFSREDWSRVCESIKDIPQDASEAVIAEHVAAAIRAVAGEDQS